MSKMYEKDSFDRFDDDLTALILNYLPFEEKLSFECVSNRWRTHMFSKEFRFELLRHKFKCGQQQHLFIRSYVHQNQTFELEPKLFKSLMKKFFNLNDLLIDNNCKCDENVLQIFIDLYNDSLKNLKTLNIRIKEDIDEEVLIEFSRLFGKTLTDISIGGLSEQRLATVVSFFGQNLVSIDLKQNLRSLLIRREAKDEELMKIEKLFLTNPSTPDFEVFVTKYGQHLKQLSLSFDQHYKYNIKDTLKYVANLANLRALRLDSELFFLKQNELSVNEQHIIDDSLKLIGQKCLRLNSVDICIFGDLISDEFLKIFGKYFHCLERLDLALWDIGNKYFKTVNSFGFREENGKHLTKLNLMFEQLCDEHLKDIHLFLPNLRAVKLNSDEHLTNDCLKHLSKLQNLRTVVLEGNIDLNYMKIDGIMEFVANCPTIKVLDIEFENDLNEVSYDVFKFMALMTPRINYYISFHDYEDRYKDLCVYVNPKNNLNVYKI